MTVRDLLAAATDDCNIYVDGQSTIDKNLLDKKVVSVSGGIDSYGNDGLYIYIK